MFVQKKEVGNNMDAKAFKSAIELLTKEKGIQEEIIYEALELALTSLIKKL